MSLVASILRTELRLHRRHGVWSAMAVATVVWVGLLALVPDSTRRALLPWVLLLDLATLGWFFVPALTLVERANGVTAALRLTRVSPAVLLWVRVGAMGAVALAAGAAVLPLAPTRSVPLTLVGVLLTSVLFSLLAVLLLGRADTMTGYLERVPAVGVAVLLPALVAGLGIWDGAVLYLSPATAALDLLRGEGSLAALGWVAAWVVGLAAVARGRLLDAALPRAPRPVRRRARADRAREVRRGPLRSFLHVDRRTLLGDRMLVLMLAGVPLLALLARWFRVDGVGWVAARHGVDVAPHLDLVWAFVLVVHTSTMFGAVVGLLFAEDRDAGVLPALATTRAGLTSLLAYRLAALGLLTAVLVAGALVITGASHAAGAAGIAATAVVAGVASVLPALVIATFVRDRIQAVAVLKAIGLPFYLPLGWWFVDGPAGWAFATVPTGWAARTFWAASVTEAVAAAAGGIALTVALAVPLARRFARSAVV